MINAGNFVYSKAAAARILDVPIHVIARFENWAYVCFVQVRGQRPTFISKKAFKQHFVDWRIQQGRSLCVAQVNREYYRVVNPKKNTVYSVWAFEDSFDCECEDYKNQVMIFGNGKACCKHAYGVLTWLGYNRLSDYVLANAPFSLIGGGGWARAKRAIENLCLPHQQKDRAEKKPGKRFNFP